MYVCIDLYNQMLYYHTIITLQFALLMGLLSMRVEWRCYTMVNGVHCVIIGGI